MSLVQIARERGKEVKLTVKYGSHNGDMERSSLVLPVGVVEAAQEERVDLGQSQL